MKLFGVESVVNKPCTIRIIPETLDDLYFLHDKFLHRGQTISATTTRKVHRTCSASKRNPTRVQLELEIKITAIYSVDSLSSLLRVKGNSTTTTKDLNAGAFHTLELNLGKEFTLTNYSWEENAIYSLRHPPKATKVLSEERANIIMNEFMEVLAMDPSRACYGLKNVEIAKDSNAIQSLMIKDDLLRSSDTMTRQKYMEVVELVKEARGEVFVLPAKHEKLSQLTGITALLRFPLCYLDGYED